MIGIPRNAVCQDKIEADPKIGERDFDFPGPMKRAMIATAIEALEEVKEELERHDLLRVEPSETAIRIETTGSPKNELRFSIDISVSTEIDNVARHQGIEKPYYRVWVTDTKTDHFDEHPKIGVGPDDIRCFTTVRPLMRFVMETCSEYLDQCMQQT